MQTLKKSIHHALESNDLNAVVSFAKENKRVLSLLMRSSYEKDTLVAWRAIRTVAIVARVRLAVFECFSLTDRE